ncbi:retrovirus-related pol polyprotein from transposon TNT 1-94 [Tanacetum coccineum]
MFSIRIHHCGTFSKFLDIQHVDDEEDIFNMVDIKVFYVHELDQMVLQLGYTGESKPLFYNYLRHMNSLDGGLYALGCDEDVRWLPFTPSKDSKVSDFVTPTSIPYGLFIHHGTSLDPPWSGLRLHLSGDKFLRWARKLGMQGVGVIRVRMDMGDKEVTKQDLVAKVVMEVLGRLLGDMVVQIVLWYLDSGCSKHMTGNRSQIMNFVSKFLGKSKKSSHKPKAEDTNQENLYLLHMDLCSPMHVASINGKMYILVIVNDYSRFMWVSFLRTKDEAPKAIIKCIKNIQVRLNATVPNVRTDNGTEYVNQTLREFYEDVGISHQTSVARTPQQNGVIERRNRTLVEAAHTMLIFSKASLFLWAEAINTSC